MEREVAYLDFITSIHKCDAELRIESDSNFSQALRNIDRISRRRLGEPYSRLQTPYIPQRNVPSPISPYSPSSGVPDLVSSNGTGQTSASSRSELFHGVSPYVTSSPVDLTHSSVNNQIPTPSVSSISFPDNEELPTIPGFNDHIRAYNRGHRFIEPIGQVSSNIAWVDEWTNRNIAESLRERLAEIDRRGREPQIGPQREDNGTQVSDISDN